MSQDHEVSSTQHVSVELLHDINAAFNSQDADRIALFFAEDAVFLMASGPEPEGRRITGREEIRQVLAERFSRIPDMRWEHIYEYIAGDNRAVTVWRVKGLATDGTVLDYQGCDLWEFENGLVKHKDTYWKIVDA